MKISAVLKNAKIAYKDTCYIRRNLKESKSGMTNILTYKEAGMTQMEYGQANPGFFKIFKQKFRDLMITGN